MFGIVKTESSVFGRGEQLSSRGGSMSGASSFSGEVSDDDNFCGEGATGEGNSPLGDTTDWVGNTENWWDISDSDEGLGSEPVKEALYDNKYDGSDDQDRKVMEDASREQPWILPSPSDSTPFKVVSGAEVQTYFQSLERKEFSFSKPVNNFTPKSSYDPCFWKPLSRTPQQDLSASTQLDGGICHSSNSDVTKESVNLADDLYLSTSEEEEDDDDSNNMDEICDKPRSPEEVRSVAAACNHNYDEDYDQDGNRVENSSKILETDQAPLIIPPFTPPRLLSTTPSELVSNQDVQAIFPEFKPGKRLRFTKLFNRSKSRYHPFRQPLLTSTRRELEESGRVTSTTPTAAESENSSWSLEAGATPPLPKLNKELEEEVMEAYNELDFILKHNESEMGVENDERENEGPAKLWYDMMDEIGDSNLIMKRREMKPKLVEEKREMKPKLVEKFREKKQKLVEKNKEKKQKLVKNKEKAPPASTANRPPSRKKIKFIPGINVTCSRCGAKGHMKTNRGCPLFPKFEAPLPFVAVKQEV